MAVGTIWMTIDKFSFMAIQLICTFILGRFLIPEDFGILGLLAVFTTVSLTLVEAGFPSAIIREKNVSSIDYSSIFWFNIGLSILLYFILFLSSGFIAFFFHQPILKNVSRVTFLVIPISALSLIQTAIFTKQLQFKKLCIVSLISSLVASIIAIFSAYYLRSVWALVLQNVTTFVIKAVLLWTMTSWIPSFKFSMVSIKKYFSFSKNLLITGLIGNIFNNIYSVFIGRFYTAADLGYYSQACRLNMAVSSSATSVIQSVSYPILVKVNNEGNDIKAAYKKIICVTVLFVSFIMALLMGVAFDLFELLMGDPIWRIAGTYLFIMCINGMLYPLHSINQNILMVKGDSKTILKLEIMRRVIMICIIIITLHFNILVFICGNAAYSIILLFLNLYYCGRPINYKVHQQIIDIIPILLRIITMVVTSLCVSTMMHDANILLRVLVSLLVCFICGVAIFWNYSYFKESLTLVKELLRKGVQRQP